MPTFNTKEEALTWARANTKFKLESTNTSEFKVRTGWDNASAVWEESVPSHSNLWVQGRQNHY